MEGGGGGRESLHETLPAVTHNKEDLFEVLDEFPLYFTCGVMIVLIRSRGEMK